MEALFLKIINMSITATWLVLAILAVRLLFHKVPKWVICLLWGLVAVRLTCPFSIESVMSFLPSAESLPKDIIYTAHPQIQSGIVFIDDAVNSMLSSSMTPVETYSTNTTQIWSFLLSRIWLFGIALMLLYSLISYLLIRKKVAAAIPLRQNIKRCDFIDSPFAIGFFVPVIYLPTKLEKRDWEHVIAHEQAHICRCDHWWKPMGFLLLSVHWFNPILWLAYILLCRDIEAACDEKVICNMDQETRRAYSSALLKCSVRQRSITACPLAFGEGGIKERISHVMNYRKPSFWIRFVSMALVLFLSVTLLTDPLQRHDPDKVYPQSVLQDPDRILVDVDGGADIVYEKDTEVYKALVDAFRRNWWKHTEENLDIASEDALVAPIAPEVLKTTSWRTYRETDDTIVCFQYTDHPVIWEYADGNKTVIETIAFVLPEKNWSGENMRGFFTISKTENFGSNEGIYTYYYPSEITNDFWDFVQTAKLNEVRTIPGKTMSLNDVITLSQLGEDLTMEDLTGFAYQEKGDALLCNRTYPIDKEWYLLVIHGGGLPKPISVWLTHTGAGEHMDITQGNEDGAVTKFIDSYSSDDIE